MPRMQRKGIKISQPVSKFCFLVLHQHLQRLKLPGSFRVREPRECSSLNYRIGEGNLKGISEQK